MAVVPFRVSHSGEAREQFAAALVRARGDGRRAVAVAAARVIERGLLWLADEFGESRQPLRVLGQARCGIELPLTVYFVVDAGRRLVFVNRYRYVPRRPPP